jgi:hypothetical protein
VTWPEGKGPDVVIEILSESTRRTDMTAKKDVYASRLHMPEYFWYDPFTGERAGFNIHGAEYVPIAPDEHDGLPSRILGLTLVRWPGVAEGVEAAWLRWATADGLLLPTPEEAERARADRAERRVAELEERLTVLERQMRELRP